MDVFHLFSACIKGCKLLADAHGMPKEYEYLRHRLKLEELKLLDWWLSRSSHNVDDFCVPEDQVHERQQTIVECLKHIKNLTFEIGLVSDRYGLSIKASDSDTAESNSTSSLLSILPEHGGQKELRLKALDYADKTWKTYPRRVRWASFDAKKFEGLILRFTGLNDAMLQLLQREERQRHTKLQENTHMQVLRVHNQLDEINLLLRSLRLDEGRMEFEPKRVSTFEHITELKALNAVFDLENVTGPDHIAREPKQTTCSPIGLDMNQLHLRSEARSNGSGTQRDAGQYGSSSVWVEWRNIEEHMPSVSFPRIQHRLSSLSFLLTTAQSSSKLQLPPCMGFVSDPNMNRVGLVFESPCVEKPLVPQSLFSMLQHSKKPSLSLRIKMAKDLANTVQYLHATNWLHKGLRSDNILFPSLLGQDSLAFWLSGFDYSRPMNDEVTELASKDRAHELYRHPDVQFDVPRDGPYGFKNFHDVYSLGVVLFEIGIWQPVNQFLGISLNQRILRPAIRGVRGSLLNESSFSELQGETGDRFAQAVKQCLAAEYARSTVSTENYTTEDESSRHAFEEDPLSVAISILDKIMV